MARTLADLRPGDRGAIAAIEGLSPALALRLLDMGFEDGAIVSYLHAGPIGADPMAVEVGGTVVGLRRAVARMIRLAPE